MTSENSSENDMARAVFDLTKELNERLDEAMAKWERRQSMRKAQRLEFARRRAAGLVQRYAEKARRNREQGA